MGQVCCPEYTASQKRKKRKKPESGVWQPDSALHLISRDGSAQRYDGTAPTSAEDSEESDIEEPNGELAGEGVVLTAGRDAVLLGHNDFSAFRPIPGLAAVVVAQVACGESHSLALSAHGEVFAWGRGSTGALGLGPLTSCTATPTLVAGDLRGRRVRAVACGCDVSAALTEVETFLWGSNAHRQIGIPSAKASVSDPKLLRVSLDPTTVLVFGARAAAALTAAGELFTWGSPTSLVGRTPTPERVLLPARVTAVACGWDHMAAVCDGSVYTWGEGTYGQLGQPAQVDRGAPQLVRLVAPTLRAPAAEFASSRSSASSAARLPRGGKAASMGGGNASDIDDDTASKSSAQHAPHALFRLAHRQRTAAAAIEAENSAALVSLYDSPPLHLSAVAAAAAPVHTTSNATTTDSLHQQQQQQQQQHTNHSTTTTAAATTTTIATHRVPPLPQLRDHSSGFNEVPYRLSPQSSVGGDCGGGGGRATSTGGIDRRDSCASSVLDAVARAGAWWDSKPYASCMAASSAGAAASKFEKGRGGGGGAHDVKNRDLGRIDPDGALPIFALTDACASAPVPVVAVACGDHYTLALTEDGSLWSWGSNSHGQLGREGPSIPVLVQVGGPVKKIVCGNTHAAALTAEGELFMWGAAVHGQLGTGRERSQPVRAPLRVLLSHTVCAVACGRVHSVVVAAQKGKGESPEEPS